jgi:hypothetical protein
MNRNERIFQAPRDAAHPAEALERERNARTGRIITCVLVVLFGGLIARGCYEEFLDRPYASPEDAVRRTQGAYDWRK